MKQLVRRLAVVRMKRAVRRAARRAKRDAAAMPAVTRALAAAEQTRMGRRLAPRIAAFPGRSGFHLLDQDLDALVARYLLIQGAEKTLDLQTYLLHDDVTGRLLVDALLQAADRGVRVRLLIDDIDTIGRELDMIAMDLHRHVEVRLFNPFSHRGIARFFEMLTTPRRINRRMHNKTLVADNTTAILGGRNIGDEYFAAHPEVQFADLDVLAIGPLVQAVSASFDAFWNSRWAVPVERLTAFRPRPGRLTDWRRHLTEHTDRLQATAYARALAESDLLSKQMGSVLSLTWAPAQLYFDPPAKVAAQDNRRSVPLIFQARPWQWNAQRELVLMTPYFVPQRRGLRLLSRLRRCGVSIRVITNSLASTDVWAAHSGYGPYRKALLHMGVEIFELKATAFRRRRRRRPWFWRDAPVRLHAKTTVVDGRWVLIGSANQDPRSNRLNTEIAVLVDSRNLARQVTAVIADAANPKNSYRLALRRSASGHEQLVWHTMENGRPAVYRQEPGAGVLRRLGAALCRLLPIEDQL